MESKTMIPVGSDKDVVERFIHYYHNVAAPWTQVSWMGHQLSKCPMDLWVFQEIIWETKPDLIIETGTGGGGSSLFFATILDGLGGPRFVLTVDEVYYPELRHGHPRVIYLTGDSLGDTVSRYLGEVPRMRTMVVLDSLHTYGHVKKELELYGPLVSPGCYLVVEDTAVDADWQKPAAQAAVRGFVSHNPGYEIDRSRERHLLTLNPGGWVRRVS